MSCCRLNLFATANPSCGGSSFKFGDQVANCFLWIASAHQCFADEKTMEPTFAKTLQRLRILQSTLTNHHCVVGSVSDESAARFQGDLKRLEIAVVPADDLARRHPVQRRLATRRRPRQRLLRKSGSDR